MRNREGRREGYWKSKEEPDLPMPVEGKKAVPATVNAALVRAQLLAEQTAYKGSSTCRICGISNGSLAYSLGGWTWPSGFLHYVEQHKVMPSKEFRDFLASQPKSLP